MNLIADSGSTETKWALTDGAKLVKYIRTQGINPFFQKMEEITTLIQETLLPELPPDLKIGQIWFYGAGCAFADKNKVLENALTKLFPSCNVEINSDLLGVCRGMLGKRRGVACILGTGSNSCLYDGDNIEEHVSPLGFILGDEGSGADLGKRLVSDCLKNQLPGDLTEKFLVFAQDSPADILDHVYRQSCPNRYLASLSRFLIENIEEPECYDIVHSAFRDFFERNILQYEFPDELPVNFAGSIAYYYRDILEKVASEYGFWIEKIEKSPLEGLIHYHS